MSTSLIHELMDTVEATELDHPDDDFVAAAFALHALAISRLTPKARENMLQDLEDGALRRAVGRFEARRPSSPDGTGRLQ